MSLYNKYRPKIFKKIVGNTATVNALKKVLEKKDPPHAYLLHGPTGCGKTTIARIIANKLGCGNDDFHELDSAHFRGIDTVREIRRNSQYKPTSGDSMVFLLDEVHKMTNDAMNALLKALEDPPEHVYYILATTEPQKLLPTLKGRCSQYVVSTLSDSEMRELLKQVVEAEKDKLDDAIYEQIILDSQGHPRDALQILEQVLVVPEKNRLEVAKKGVEVKSQVIELCRALLANASWNKIAPILKGLKEEDEESIRRVVLGYCNSVLLNGTNTQAALIMDAFMEPFYNSGKPMLTWCCYNVVMK